MDIRNRVILPLYRKDISPSNPSFDFAPLLLNLLLFDEVIVPSLAFEDIAALAKTIGAAQTRDLLNSGFVKVRAAADSIGSVSFGDPRLIQLRHISGTYPDAAFERYLEAFDDLNEDSKVKQSIEDALRSCWIRPTSEDRWGVDAISDTVRDVTTGSPMFHRAVEQILRTRGIITPITLRELSVCIHDPSTQTLRFKYRIPGLDVKSASEVVTKACRTVSELNGFIGKMNRDQAVATLDSDLLPLMDAKLQFVCQSCDPRSYREEFQRVVNVLQLPDLSKGIEEQRVDIEEFLKIKATAECIQFRDFLRRSEKITDEEMLLQLKGFRARLGLLASDSRGKSVRVLAATLLSIFTSGIEGILLGSALGLADTFLLEKVLPKSGIASFVGKQYPSIFK